MKPLEIIKLIIRVALGGMFITTAIFKLLSIDEFELYIYSFELFDYVLVTIISRLVIAFEFLMGVGLIAKIKYKYVWWLTMLMMIGFTLFLIYVAIFRNDSNCHCFGEFVELNPVHSIFKNLITIIFMLFVYKENDYQFRFKKLVMILAFAVALIVPFVVIPMDAVYNKFKSPQKEVNVEMFEALKQDSIMQKFNVEEGNHIVAFFISQCKFCKLGIKKVHSIVERNNLDSDKVKIVISGEKERISLFKKESGTESYNYFPIPAIYSLRTVNGSFPTFLYITDGKVVKAGDLRSLEEADIVEFLR